MAATGLDETSGDWIVVIGLPGKSGSGGLITVAPGKGGLATYSPPLDAAGNSVRGQLTAAVLSERLGLHLLASQPEAGEGRCVISLDRVCPRFPPQSTLEKAAQICAVVKNS